MHSNDEKYKEEFLSGNEYALSHSGESKNFFLEKKEFKIKAFVGLQNLVNFLRIDFSHFGQF